MTTALIFSINKDVIQIYDDKDIELFCQDLIDVILEADRSVGSSERYYLVLKMTISGLKSYFPLITFFDSHLVIGTSQIQLGKPPYLS